LNLSIRKARIDDIDRIDKFRIEIFGEQLAQQVSAFELYRILRHGYSVVVENSGEIVGLELGFGYNSPEDPSDYALMICTAPHLRGRGIGVQMHHYANLHAMQYGGRVRRLITRPNNHSILSYMLNKVGHASETFFPDLFHGGKPRLMLAVSLSKESYGRNTIDQNKLNAFINESRKGQDYQLIAEGDHDLLLNLHNEGFSIVAMRQEDNQFVAIPTKNLMRA
jgi:GNAT superfamily N-acetyltransferase